MAQLSSAARSASEFAGWMLTHYSHPTAPLASMRVLLSPGPDEVLNAELQQRLPKEFAATGHNAERAIAGFMKDCSSFLDNIAVVYAVGHGVQLSKTGSVVLLEDCGDTQHLTPLKSAVDMACFHAAMNHAGTAQTQFWFVDACRQRPEIAQRFEGLEAGIRLPSPEGFARSSTIFYAASTGKQAFARIGGISLFTEALLSGLGGRIAAAPESGISNRWHVSAIELVRRLPAAVQTLASQEGEEQTIEATGRIQDALFHEYVRVPEVDLQVQLWPEERVEGCKGSLRQGFEIIRDGVEAWPLRERVAAGIYEMQVIPPRGDPIAQMQRAVPPVFDWQIEV